LNSKKNLIIFDLDGVLINSLPNMQYALKKTSIYLDQKLNFKEYKKHIGLPFEKIMLNMGVLGDYSNIKSLYVKFSNQNISKIRILDAKLNALKKLKKKNILAIFTSKDKFRTYKILKKYRLFEHFITSDDVMKGKPNPEGILKILKKTKINKKKCYFVGDTKYDFRAAKAARVNYLHVVWGIEKKLKYNNIKYIKSISEIRKLI
jgi:HAD superfamily hydrolase (TIGR01549 family)